MIVTIDGPAGTGKSTVARRVAERLQFNYFDTGAIYRALTFSLLEKGVSLSDESALKKALETFDYKILKGRHFIGSEDVTEQIRTPNVTRNVSEVSAQRIVREAFLTLQRKFGSEGDSVFEGRDMGTVVFPDAQVKVFLTARPEIRAKRRFLEIKDKAKTTLDEVLKEIIARDEYDSNRPIAPLKPSVDAHLVDTSDLTIDEVVEAICQFIKRSP